MMAELPASRLTTIPGCGHVPQQECPSRFGSALLDVLTMPPPLPVMKNVEANEAGTAGAAGR